MDDPFAPRPAAHRFPESLLPGIIANWIPLKNCCFWRGCIVHGEDLFGGTGLQRRRSCERAGGRTSLTHWLVEGDCRFRTGTHLF